MFTVTVKRNQRVNLKAIEGKIKGPSRVKVGLPAGKADSDNIMKAIWNNFGTQNIPERPFMQNAMRANRSSYRAAMISSASKILRGETSLRSVLSKLGTKAQGDIQAEITALSSPPNAPSTIRQKGSSNPLVDTGEMRSSITWTIWE